MNAGNRDWYGFATSPVWNGLTLESPATPNRASSSELDIRLMCRRGLDRGIQNVRGAGFSLHFNRPLDCSVPPCLCVSGPLFRRLLATALAVSVEPTVPCGGSTLPVASGYGYAMVQWRAAVRKRWVAGSRVSLNEALQPTVLPCGG